MAKTGTWGGKRTGAGRPFAEIKNIGQTISLKESHKEEIRKRAAIAGLSPSQYVRRILQLTYNTPIEKKIAGIDGNFYKLETVNLVVADVGGEKFLDSPIKSFTLNIPPAEFEELKTHSEQCNIKITEYVKRCLLFTFDSTYEKKLFKEQGVSSN